MSVLTTHVHLFQSKTQTWYTVSQYVISNVALYLFCPRVNNIPHRSSYLSLTLHPGTLTCRGKCNEEGTRGIGRSGRQRDALNYQMGTGLWVARWTTLPFIPHQTQGAFINLSSFRQAGRPLWEWTWTLGEERGARKMKSRIKGASERENQRRWMGGWMKGTVLRKRIRGWNQKKRFREVWYARSQTFQHLHSVPSSGSLVFFNPLLGFQFRHYFQNVAC